MQAEASDSSLREGIEALGVKDTEKPVEGKEEEGSTEQQDTEMTTGTEEDTTTKDEKGSSYCEAFIHKTDIGHVQVCLQRQATRVV